MSEFERLKIDDTEETALHRQFSDSESGGGTPSDAPLQRQFSDSESDGNSPMNSSPRSPLKTRLTLSAGLGGRPPSPGTPGSRASANSFLDQKDYLQIEVVDYFCEGTGQCYNHHFYVIDVRVEEQNWQIDRCILDFVELDRKLRKRYPRCSFMSLPISESSLQTLYADLDRHEKSHPQQHANTLHTAADYNDQPIASSRSSGTASSLAEGLFGWSSSSASASQSQNSVMQLGQDDHDQHGRSTSVASTLEVHSIDHMAQKADTLNMYLHSLMDHHELLVSDELCTFVDQEAANMTTQVSKIEPLSIHDILLLNEPEYKCIVRKREEVTVTVRNNQILVWRFNTQDYDIAFSVDLNGETKVSYTRYNSHIAPVCGVLLVDDVVSMGGYSPGESPLTGTSSRYRGRLHSNSSRCTLNFDNSYAKLHTKKLSWSARVVSIEEYHEAKEQAMECQKERKQFELQRYAFKRIAVRLAASRSGVIHHTSSVVADYMEEEVLEQRDLLKTNEFIKKEIEALHLEKIEANKARQVAEARLAEVPAETNMVLELQAKLDEAKAALVQEHGRREGLERRLLSTEKDLKDKSKKLEVLSERVEAAAGAAEKITSMNKTCSILQSKVLALTADCKQKDDAYKELERAMTSALAQADAAVVALEQKLDVATKQVTELSGGGAKEKDLTSRIEETSKAISQSAARSQGKEEKTKKR